MPLTETDIVHRSLYKYVSIEILKKILNGQIRFTQPGALNDPFELLPKLYVPAKKEDSAISIQFDLLAPTTVVYQGDSEHLLDTTEVGDFVARDIIQVLNESIGILCLTENPESLTMWAHYGDRYKGALIEFDSTHDFFSGCHTVFYRDRRPTIPLEALQGENPFPISRLFVKSRQWEYEKEVRVVRALTNCRQVSEENGFPVFVMDLPLEVIKAIMLGERTPVSNQKSIWDIVKNTNIALEIATVDFYEYGFRMENLKWNLPIPQGGPHISPRTSHIFVDDPNFGEGAGWMRDHHPLSPVVNKKV